MKDINMHGGEIGVIMNNESLTTLNRIKKGTEVMVHRLLGEGDKRRRLAEMGITPNTKIKVKRIAPLGDPIEITLRGYELSLRAQDALEIEVYIGRQERDRT